MANKDKKIILGNTNSRNIAVNCLQLFEQDETLIQDSITSIFENHELDDKIKRMAIEMAYGCCRHMLTLDHMINKYSNRKQKKIHPTILNIIRLGLYQFFYMDSIPDYAIVNEAVKQSRSIGEHKSSKFVNAILRSAQRDIEEGKSNNEDSKIRATIIASYDKSCVLKNNILPHPVKQPAKYFSIAFGFPKWLTQRWCNQFKPAVVRDVCIANNSRPLLAIRANTLKITKDELLKSFHDNNIKCRLYGEGIQILQSINPASLPGFHDGHFYVQDITAMKVAPKLEVTPGMKVLDMCAAPGGKATHLAQLMENNGSIIASDISTDKLDKINENCKRLGIDIIQTVLIEDETTLDKYTDQFDAILLDVPCSNTGVLARRIEVRHTLSPSDLSRNSRTQFQLLERAVKYLKPGGNILYSTCSIEPAENNLLIKNFIEQFPEFTISSQELTLPTIGKQDSDNPDEKPIWHEGGYTAFLKCQA